MEKTKEILLKIKRGLGTLSGLCAKIARAACFISSVAADAAKSTEAVLERLEEELKK